MKSVWGVDHGVIISKKVKHYDPLSDLWGRVNDAASINDSSRKIRRKVKRS